MKGLALGGKDDRKLGNGGGRSKAVREITAAREKATAKSGNGRRRGEGETDSSIEGNGGSIERRNARTCKKCPPGVDGLQPVKPGPCNVF